MTLSLVQCAPKKLHWKVEIDGRDSESEEELLDFVRANSRGAVYWMKTNFSDTGKTHACASRKRNFRDGYNVYTFWFARKADAALVKIMRMA